jgi:hypothetical protein
VALAADEVQMLQHLNEVGDGHVVGQLLRWRLMVMVSASGIRQIRPRGADVNENGWLAAGLN